MASSNIINQILFLAALMLILISLPLISSAVFPSNAQAVESSNTITNPFTNKTYLVDGNIKSIFVIDGETNRIISTIPFEKSNSNQFGIDPNILIQALTVAVAAATALTGIRTAIKSHKENEATRKKDTMKDIILPLIDEFDKSDEAIRFAKNILDDIPIPSTQSKGHQFYDRKKLLDALKDHKTSIKEWEEGDDIVRHSFDRFLDFLTKLEYMHSVGLLDNTSLNYFRYYIDKAGDNIAVINYLRIYKFPLYGKLHPNLDSRLPLIKMG